MSFAFSQMSGASTEQCGSASLRIVLTVNLVLLRLLNGCFCFAWRFWLDLGLDYLLPWLVVVAVRLCRDGSRKGRWIRRRKCGGHRSWIWSWKCSWRNVVAPPDHLLRIIVKDIEVVTASAYPSGYILFIS